MDFVKLELEGTVCVITIDRPKALNALNRQVLTELSEAVAQIAANKVARADSHRQWRRPSWRG